MGESTFAFGTPGLSPVEGTVKMWVSRAMRSEARDALEPSRVTTAYADSRPF